MKTLVHMPSNQLFTVLLNSFGILHRLIMTLFREEINVSVVTRTVNMAGPGMNVTKNVQEKATVIVVEQTPTVSTISEVNYLS